MSLPFHIQRLAFAFDLLIIVRNLEVSDTTGDARSGTAGYQIVFTTKRQGNYQERVAAFISSSKAEQ